MNWAQIPLDLRERNQWCVAAGAGMYSPKGKEPLGVNDAGRFFLASSTQPGTWMSFEKATNAARAYGLHVGYMLTEDDPFTCIDFDVKDAANAPDKPETWTTREEMEVYYSYLRQFDTYTEWSASAKGFHAWVRGNIGRGARRRGIEVYSQERFIITTGDVVSAKPIEHRESMIEGFAEFLRPRGLADDIILVEEEEVEADFSVLKTAINAANADKFAKLWLGDITGFQSQSEADLALMSMFTFYSKSNEQCRRLFRMSKLGRWDILRDEPREKAFKDDRYLNFTLRTIRKRMHDERAIDASKLMISVNGVIVDKQKELAAQELASIQGYQDGPVETVPMGVTGQPIPMQQLPNTAAALARAAPVHVAVHAVASEGIAWPPGVAGRIAQFVYRSAPRPVKEVAVVAAIGLLAGLCGKAWHTSSRSGLNMYVTLVAKSAIGKEAMNTGMSLLVKEVSKQNPPFGNHVVFSTFASGPALTKFVATQSSFVNVNGEWGKKLKLMARSEDGRNQAMDSLRTAMTDLYQKSGPDSIVGGINYSQSENNTTGSITGVAYSMIGETVPETFYESLTEDMMADGFLSRFLTIEYTGDRPDKNRSMLRVPDSALVEVLSNIATTANRVATFTAPSKTVECDPDAQEILEAFEDECDKNIRSTQNASYRQMWNRASLKAQRLSCLLAVADHHLFPVVNRGHVEWSIDVMRRDIAVMQSRIETGDVGITDGSRERKMLAVLRHYKQNQLPAKRRESQQKFKDNGIVTREYLQVYTRSNMAFAKFRGGAIQALDLTLKSFIQLGYIAEYEKAKASANFGFHGVCYQILNLPDTGDEE